MSKPEHHVTSGKVTALAVIAAIAIATAVSVLAVRCTAPV